MLFLELISAYFAGDLWADKMILQKIGSFKWKIYKVAESQLISSATIKEMRL